MNVRVPRARNTDPETSHEAADSVKMRRNQKAVLQVFKDDPSGFTDWELVRVYPEYKELPVQSESGLRTRRKELVEQGLVIDTGRKQRLPSGRRAIIWCIADEG